MPFSALRILKEGLTGNKNWEPHWRNPSPKSKYDVIIIGGGGHGLSTAYYLAKNHGIKMLQSSKKDILVVVTLAEILLSLELIIYYLEILNFTVIP